VVLERTQGRGTIVARGLSPGQKVVTEEARRRKRATVNEVNP
jgi:hypothetical protein